MFLFINPHRIQNTSITQATSTSSVQLQQFDSQHQASPTLTKAPHADLTTKASPPTQIDGATTRTTNHYGSPLCADSDSSKTSLDIASTHFGTLSSQQSRHHNGGARSCFRGLEGTLPGRRKTRENERCWRCVIGRAATTSESLLLPTYISKLH